MRGTVSLRPAVYYTVIQYTVSKPLVKSDCVTLSIKFTELLFHYQFGCFCYLPSCTLNISGYDGTNSGLCAGHGGVQTIHQS